MPGACVWINLTRNNDQERFWIKHFDAEMRRVDIKWMLILRRRKPLRRQILCLWTRQLTKHARMKCDRRDLKELIEIKWIPWAGFELFRQMAVLTYIRQNPKKTRTHRKTLRKPTCGAECIYTICKHCPSYYNLRNHVFL